MAMEAYGTDATVFLRSLFEGMPEGCAHCRMLFEDGKPVDWVYLRVNAAFATLTGLRDCLGRKITELLPGIRATSPELFELYGRVARGGGPEHCDTFVPTLGLWLSVDVIPAQPETFIAIFRVAPGDRGERPRLMIELLQSEARYQALFDGCPDGISLTRLRDGRILDVNAAWEALLGFSRGEALGRTGLDLGLFPDPGVRAAVLNGLPASGPIPLFTVEMTRKDGSVLEAEVTGMVLQMRDEPCLLAAIRDLAREAAVRRALVATDRRFAQIMGGLQDYIMILDPEGLVTYINKPTATHPTCRILGSRFPTTTAKEPARRGHKAVQQCIQTGRTVTYSTPGPRLDGSEGWFEIRIEPCLREGRLESMVVLAFDRTDARHAEQAEQRALKSESLALMAGSIAHDFNNLFASLSASIEILDLKARDREDLTPVIALAKSVLKRATGLSWKMNDFAGHAVARMQPLDLAECLPVWVAALRAGHGQRALDLEVREVPLIQADPVRIRKVFEEFVINAWEALDELGLTGAGPRVRLGMILGHDRSGAALQASWVTERPKGPATVCLEIENDGPRPEPEVQQRMFDPFFTTKALGRGLGLASSKGILQAHRAGLQVLPGLTRGVTFGIHFPVAGPGSVKRP